MKDLIKLLNQPFTLWFMSSVVIGLVTWQYSEVQKNNTEAKIEHRLLKRANLELMLLLQDIKYGSETNQELTIGLFSATFQKMTYNALNKEATIYLPSLQNIMLEIDSRTTTDGLSLYQPKIMEHVYSMSATMIRTGKPGISSNALIWKALTKTEQEKFISLGALTDEILSYYSKMANN